MKYKVYFEIYGKKMQTEIFAENEQKAKEIVKSKIIFHKIEKQKTADTDFMDLFNGLINRFK